MQVEKGRTLLYISRKLVNDSAWCFEPGDRVTVTLDPKSKRLIIEREAVRTGRTDRRSQASD